MSMYTRSMYTISMYTISALVCCVQQNTSHLRTTLLVLATIFGVLPLGMLRSIDSLSHFSAVSLTFYAVFALHVCHSSISCNFNLSERVTNTITVLLGGRVQSVVLATTQYSELCFNWVHKKCSTIRYSCSMWRCECF